MGKGWCEAIICLTLADVMVKHFYYISHSFVIFGKANTAVPDALLLWRVAIFHSFVFSPLWQAGFNIAPLSQHTHMHSIPVPVQFRPQLCWYPAAADIYILDWTCWSKSKSFSASHATRRPFWQRLEKPKETRPLSKWMEAWSNPPFNVIAGRKKHTEMLASDIRYT